MANKATGGKQGGNFHKSGKKKELDLDGGWMKKKLAGDKASGSQGKGSSSSQGAKGGKPGPGKGQGSKAGSAKGNGGKGASKSQGAKGSSSKAFAQKGGKANSAKGQGSRGKADATRGKGNGSRGKADAARGAQTIAKPQVASTYDFNAAPNRRGTFSMKWDIAEDEIPMWVADMDIPTAPAITQAMVDRAASGVYGYSTIPAEFRTAVCDWWDRRHGIRFDEKDVLFCNGVIPAIGSLVRTLTNPEDAVLVQPPVYNHFYTSITENGRKVMECPLDYDGKYYFIDWEDLEEKLALPEVTMMIVCNPQNPTGTLWSAEDLAHIGELCSMNDVVVVSDEIHCDIVAPGKHHVPFAAASPECRDISITCCSPSKAFNTAGVQSAYVICTNSQLNEAVKEGMAIDDVAFPNAFAMDAIITAYTKCDQWLDDLNKFLWDNKEEATHYIEQRLPEIVVVPSDSTYLVWLDCMELASDCTELCDAIREETGLILSPGSIYGSTGEPFLRMNVACSKAQLQEALRRLDSFFNLYE